MAERQSQITISVFRALETYKYDMASSSYDLLRCNLDLKLKANSNRNHNGIHFVDTSYCGCRKKYAFFEYFIYQLDYLLDVMYV
jgi:hypothetical protein